MTALVKPRAVTVNDKSPVGKPSGRRTMMYEPLMPVTPVTGPTFSTGKLRVFACTDNIEAEGIGGENIARFDVNRIIRVWPSALKL